MPDCITTLRCSRNVATGRPHAYADMLYRCRSKQKEGGAEVMGLAYSTESAQRQEA
jgi:hypothetical protein